MAEKKLGLTVYERVDRLEAQAERIEKKLARVLAYWDRQDAAEAAGKASK